jgi:undecaprenyl-diphosphatase
MINDADLMLERLDQQLFLFLNSINSPFWDKVMYAVSGTVIWIPLYVVILIFIAKKYKRKFLVLVLFITVAVLIADQSSVHLFKNAFGRLRPCHEPAIAGMVHIVRGECGGLYGFVSSHATNSFNVALLSLLLVKNNWYSAFIIFWAAVISYSRIYLGVHYPGDVICGALLGSLVGWIIYRLYGLTDNMILENKEFFKK